MRIARFAVLAWVVAVSPAAASPITLAFRGDAVSTIPSLNGNDALVYMTYDPALNLAAGFAPPNAGSYRFAADIWLEEAAYRYNGVIEVNYDLTFGQPLTGQLRLVTLSFTGPATEEGFNPFMPTGPFFGQLFAAGLVDPASPNLPTLLRFPLVLGFSGNQTASLRVTPTIVNPEPGTWLLLGTGLAIVIGRRLRARLAPRP
jgi:hypothetical protein